MTNATRKSFFHLRLGVLTLVVDMDVVVDKDKATKKGWGRFKGFPGNRACGPGAEKHTHIHSAGPVGGPTKVPTGSQALCG